MQLPRKISRLIDDLAVSPDLFHAAASSAGTSYAARKLTGLFFQMAVLHVPAPGFV